MSLDNSRILVVIAPASKIGIGSGEAGGTIGVWDADEAFGLSVRLPSSASSGYLSDWEFWGRARSGKLSRGQAAVSHCVATV